MGRDSTLSDWLSSEGRGVSDPHFFADPDPGKILDPDPGKNLHADPDPWGIREGKGKK